MKRFMVLVAVAATMASLALVATAGDYHVGRSLVCSDCHIAHGSQKHGYSSEADTVWRTGGSVAPPYNYLLRGETVNNACLNCHDGKAGIPDVLGTTAEPPVHGRSAGALSVPTGGAHGYTNAAPYAQSGGHTLWSTDPPPGATTYPAISAHGLECSDCHRVHGNKYFRNMSGDTLTSTATFIDALWKGKQVTYEIGATPSANPATAWVLEKAPHNYDNDNVQHMEVDQTRSAYGEWCGTCHSTFHGNTSSPNIEPIAGEVHRHPTAGVEMSTSSWKITDATHRLKVMDKAGAWATAGTASADMTPSCFTCHKSHGNANNFGLIFTIPQGDGPLAGSSAPPGAHPSLIMPNRNAAMTEEGDGGEYRDMCRNCHGMGRWPTGNPINIR